MSEIREQQIDTRANREVKRPGRPSSQDRHNRSTTQHTTLPSPIQVPPPLCWMGQEGAGNQANVNLGWPLSWISISFLELEEKSGDGGHKLEKWTWYRSQYQKFESDLCPFPPALGKYFTPVRFHCLNWKFRTLADLVSALNSDELHFYKEMNLSIVSPAQLDQQSSSSSVAKNIEIKIVLEKTKDLLLWIKTVLIKKPLTTCSSN